MSSGRSNATKTIIGIGFLTVLIVLGVALVQGFSKKSKTPPPTPPSMGAQQAPAEPISAGPTAAPVDSSGGITSISSPQPNTSIYCNQIDISGSTTAVGPLMHVRILDLSNNVLFDKNAVPVENGIFRTTATLNVTVTTTVKIEAFQDTNNTRIAYQAIQVNLLPARILSTPTIPAAATPTFISWTGQSLQTNSSIAGADLTLTEPLPNARVTFPLHIAGFLHTPYGLSRLEARLAYNDIEVTGSFETIAWGSVNVFIYNLDGALPITTTPATFSIRDTATGNVLTTRPVTLVGENEAGRLNIYLFSGDQLTPHERRVPTMSVGPNLALSELFWGLSPQEVARYQTFIPTPEQIYRHMQNSNPRNALVHVRDLHVNQWGVAMVTLSENMLACSDSDRAARQIQSTLQQFTGNSGIQDIAIAVADQLWKPSSNTNAAAPPSAGGAANYYPPTPTAQASYSINLVSPAENETVSNNFRVMGSATVPPDGRMLQLKLTLATGEVVVNRGITVTGAPGELGNIDANVTYNTTQATNATLSISYTDAAGTRFSDQHNIQLLSTQSPQSQ